MLKINTPVFYLITRDSFKKISSLLEKIDIIFAINRYRVDARPSIA
jgi:hypothetical protein